MNVQDTLALILGVAGGLGMLIAFWEKIFNSGKKDENISNRVGDLEKNFDCVSKDIKTIKENHLTHMQADINKIQVSIAEINTTLKYINSND